MIVPTATSITYAQQTAVPFSAENDPALRQYGPQAVTGSSSNSTVVINTTAAGGIQDMRQLMLSLGSEIQRENLTGIFNEVVMAFAYIQTNLTALQNHTSNITSELATARAEVTQANTALAEVREELQLARAALETEAEIQDTAAVAAEEETEETEATEEEQEQEQEQETEEVEDDDDDEQTSSSSTTTTTTTDGPRLDPEGDGGFPGDIDG